MTLFPGAQPWVIPNGRAGIIMTVIIMQSDASLCLAGCGRPHPHEQCLPFTPGCTGTM